MRAVDDFLEHTGGHIPPADSNGWDPGHLTTTPTRRTRYRHNPSRRPEPRDNAWDHDPPDDLDRYYGADV